MKVFVTGATGFVGDEIVRQLHQTGHSVRMLVRNKRLEEARDRTEAEIHVGNILNTESLQGALKGVNAVIHLVGIISEVGDSTFENVHVRGAKNIVAAAREQGVKRFAHMSALGTRANAVSHYHRTKWEAEEIVRGSGLDYTIFRPSLIFGPRDMFVNLFAKIIRRSPIVPILGRRDAKFQPVAIETVADAFVKSLTEVRAVGQTFDLAGPEVFTRSEIIDQILAVMRRKRLRVHFPAAIAQMQAGILEFLFQKILRRVPPLNRDQLIMLQEDNVGNAQPANELFGLRTVPFRDGIARYLDHDATMPST
jgi:NADH dehydrogenase